MRKMTTFDSYRLRGIRHHDAILPLWPGGSNDRVESVDSIRCPEHGDPLAVAMNVNHRLVHPDLAVLAGSVDEVYPHEVRISEACP